MDIAGNENRTILIPGYIRPFFQINRLDYLRELSGVNCHS